MVLEQYILSNNLYHYNHLDSPKGLAFQTLDICSTYTYKLAQSGALMYTLMDILIQSVDIKRGESPDSTLNFYDQVVRVGKGWVEHEFVLFITCLIATRNKVAK